jgi:myo-inositol 2-dehydrogenase/D-chiro-inositol 1-dehydrogenase
LGQEFGFRINARKFQRPSHARKTMGAQKLEFCQFGAGRIGAIHAGNIAASGRANLRYVVDVNEHAATELANKHGGRPSTTEEALADPTVDAVLIASPTDTHAELIEVAAKAGKAIFCEKPIDLDLARVDHAADIVKQAGVPILIAFNRRFDPTLGGLGEAVRRGEVGEVETVIITSRDPAPPPVDYIAGSGGLFLDMMIHDFDMAHWILGEVPDEVFARGSNLVDPEIGKAGDVDTAVVTLTTKSGKLCQISNSRRAVYGYDQRIEAFGADGMIRAGNRNASSLESWTKESVSREKPLYFFLERYEEAYRNEMTHFLDCLEGKATPLVGMEEGRVALALGLAAKESMETGLPVKIS